VLNARCVAIVLAATSISAGQPAPTLRTPVVIELFTSEGCSSCPPADALLSKLALTQDVSGAEVIALGFHVTYWDRLGWKDPFSLSQATDRQQQYSRVFGEDRIYTPQMVVDGREEMVGSDEHAVRQAVARLAKAPHTRISLEPHFDERGVTARIVVPDLPPGIKEPLDLIFVVIEGHLSTQVKRGENANRLLKHDAVVRGMSKVGMLDGTTKLPFEVNGFLPAAKEERLRPENPWQVVAILQGRSSGRIWGSGIR
jgi:hypothetical protein